MVVKAFLHTTRKKVHWPVYLQDNDVCSISNPWWFDFSPTRSATRYMAWRPCCEGWNAGDGLVLTLVIVNVQRWCCAVVAARAQKTQGLLEEL